MAVVGEHVSERSSYLGSSGELHVLAVDDSIVDRKVIERLLKIASCRVTAVDSGTRALQYLGLDGNNSSVQFDDMKVNLIMTDYSMPGMTGYELLKKIKESKAFKEVPVVIMSSENILTRIDRCLEEGAEDYIVKPVKLSDVRRLKDFVMKSDSVENGEKETQQQAEEDNTKTTLPPSISQPRKVSPVVALTTASMLSHSPSSCEHLAKRPRLCNVE